MKSLLATLTLLFTLAGSVVAQTNFPLDPSQWLLDPQQTDQGMVFAKKGTLAFWFPAYATTPDDYAGYLLLPWTQALTGSTFSATVQVITFPAGTVPVRFTAPYNGGCVSEGRVYIFFQTGQLYNGIEGTQWWAAADAWPIGDTGTATVIISAALNDPSRWASVYAHSGTELPAEFANAKAHPTYVGLTFGGNCANGHGLNTRKGEAQFRLVSLTVQ
jgi:hypothetical protein